MMAAAANLHAGGIELVEVIVEKRERDQAAQAEVADIDEESAGTSLMPVGLVDQLSRQELADLASYLFGLGREGL